MANNANNLESILKAEIKKTDGDKALEAVTRQVKSAKKNMQFEIASADEALDTAKDALAATIRNANASGRAIVDAERAVTVAEKNLAELNTVFSARF